MVRFASVLAVGLVAAWPSVAQDSTLWKRIGNWDISIDATIGNGCYTLASWTGGTVFRLGLNPELDNYYVLIGNDKWGSLKAEESYDIQLRFDDKAPWDVSMRGLQFTAGETVYLHAQSTDFDFIDEFMLQASMTISYQGNKIETLSLSGSKRAFEEVLACQEHVTAQGIPSDDPFASGSKPESKGRKSEDPFAD